ncbi:Protein RKD3 [Platanthera guangdongensis]|uniref:Protein RKD3 n=1 Tax=Platanthera guangdongensis TaxID=2320717 RepID=A0ABR2LHN9_9ASPA
MMRRVRKKEDIGFEEVAQHFRVPINIAAKELKIGVTLLKQRCRELNIPRWPCRKLKSLDALIKNVQELAATGQVEEEQRKATVEMLEEERRKMENKPIMDIEDNTKVLRQACFKANYRRKRLFISMQASD